MSTFKEAIQKRDFVVTAELNLARETAVAEIVKQATVLDVYTGPNVQTDLVCGQFYLQ